MTQPKIIKQGGKKYAVILYDDYEHLLDQLEELQDAKAIRAARSSKEERIPKEIADRILDGENEIKVFREYRGLTQQQLANKAKISRNYLSMLETGKRTGTMEIFKTLAKILHLSVDDLT